MVETTRQEDNDNDSASKVEARSHCHDPTHSSNTTPSQPSTLHLHFSSPKMVRCDPQITRQTICSVVALPSPRSITVVVGLPGIALDFEFARLFPPCLGPNPAPVRGGPDKGASVSGKGRWYNTEKGKIQAASSVRIEAQHVFHVMI